MTATPSPRPRAALYAAALTLALTTAAAIWRIHNPLPPEPPRPRYCGTCGAQLDPRLSEEERRAHARDEMRRWLREARAE